MTNALTVPMGRSQGCSTLPQFAARTRDLWQRHQDLEKETWDIVCLGRRAGPSAPAPRLKLVNHPASHGEEGQEQDSLGQTQRGKESPGATAFLGPLSLTLMQGSSPINLPSTLRMCTHFTGEENGGLRHRGT